MVRYSIVSSIYPFVTIIYWVRKNEEFTHMTPFFMNTERIGFRTWTLNDLDIAAQMWGDKDVSKYIHNKSMLSVNEVHSRLKGEIKTQEQYNIQYWPIFSLNGLEHIGCCGLRPYGDSNEVSEIGFHLNKKYWGTGLALEAANKVVDYAFTDLGFQRLFSGHHPENRASEKLLLKLGFEFSHKELYGQTGEEHPSYFLSRLKYTQGRRP